MLCWGQFCALQPNESRWVLRCTIAKPITCVRTALGLKICTPITRGWPPQTKLCLAASWILSQMVEKAKKQILQTWDSTFYYANILPYTTGSGVKLPLPQESIRTFTCQPEDVHPFWWAITGSTRLLWQWSYPRRYHKSDRFLGPSILEDIINQTNFLGLPPKDCAWSTVLHNSVKLILRGSMWAFSPETEHMLIHWTFQLHLPSCSGFFFPSS